VRKHAPHSTSPPQKRFEPRNPDWEAHGARQLRPTDGHDPDRRRKWAPWRPAIAKSACLIRADLTQQNGFFHAGITSTIVDSAGGYAGLTLMPVGSDVLTVEFKLNLLAPADGEYLVAEGQVLKTGRNLVVSRGEVYAIRNGQRHPLRDHATNPNDDACQGEKMNARNQL
jgi:uncharacterized protein (TIGR00369 family)